MHLLQTPGTFTQTVDALAALIALLIAFYFVAAYKKYSAEMQHHEMLDQFLNDSKNVSNPF
mgnify:CR=1 FL=1